MTVNMPAVGDLGWGETVNTAVETLDGRLDAYAGDAIETTIALVDQVLSDPDSDATAAVKNVVDSSISAQKNAANGIASVNADGLVIDTFGNILASRSDTDTHGYVLNATRFGLDPLGTVNAGPIISAVIAAVPQGSTLVIPAGTYMLSTAITVVDKTIYIDATQGVTWIRGGRPQAFAVSATWGSIYSVTSAIDGTITRGSRVVPVTTLNIAATGIPWIAGDQIKVFSDDRIPERRPAAIYVGQLKVTGTSTLTGDIDHNFTVGQTITLNTSTVTGLTAGNTYYVVSVPSSKSVQLSATSGGSVISGLSTDDYVRYNGATLTASNNTVATPNGQAHGMPVNGTLTLYGISAGTGLVSGTEYWITSVPTPSTMTVSATQGGANISITANGTANYWIEGASESRQGEFATVYSISASGGNTQVVLSKALGDTYSWNVRAAKPNVHSFDLVGGTIDCPVVGANYVGSASQVWTAPTIELNSIVGGSVRDVTIPRAPSRGIQYTSCVDMEFSGNHISNLTDNATNNQLGYAFFNAESENCVVERNTIRNVRHGYTDDSTRTLPDIASPSPWNYGRSSRDTVSYNYMSGATSVAISPHHNGQNHLFLANRIIGGMTIAMGARGRFHRFVLNEDEGCIGSFALVQDEDGGKVYGIELVQHTGRSAATGAPVIGAVINSVEGFRDSRTHLTVDGGTFSRNDFFLQAVHANIKLKNAPRFIAPSTVASGRNLIEGTDSIIDISDVEFDLTSITSASGGTYRLAYQPDAISAIIARNIYIRNNAASHALVSNYFASGSGSKVGAANTLFAYMPSTNALSTPFFSALSADSYGTWMTEDGTGSSNLFLRDSGSITAAFTLKRNNEQELYISYQQSSTGSKTLGALGPGSRIGQKLTITVMGLNDTDILTINSSTAAGTRFRGNTAITLINRQSVTLVWSSTGFWYNGGTAVLS